MGRQKFYLAISMASRIGSGVVMLLFLARGLGPTDYGFIVTVFAYAQLIALLTDFGFSVQALRDIGAEPRRAGVIISACFRVKNILVLLASVLALAVLLFLPLRPELQIACALLYASTIAFSYGDLALIPFRGIGRYDYEAYVVVGGTLLFAILVGGTAFFFPDILAVSAALLVARLAYMTTALVFISRTVTLENPLVGPVREVWSFTKSSVGLAFDTILTVLSTQLDIIFVSALLGLEAVSIYQIASRVAGYLLLPAQVFSGVYMPSLAALHHSGQSGRELERRMQIEFLGLGLFFGVSFAVSMPYLAPFLFGQGFSAPVEVWGLFGVLVAARFIAAAFGVALVARRGVRFRVMGQGLGVLMIVVGLPILLPRFGLVAAPVTMIGATLVTLVVYSIAVTLLRGRSKTVAGT